MCLVGVRPAPPNPQPATPPRARTPVNSWDRPQTIPLTAQPGAGPQDHAIIDLHAPKKRHPTA